MSSKHHRRSASRTLQVERATSLGKLSAEFENKGRYLSAEAARAARSGNKMLAKSLGYASAKNERVGRYFEGIAKGVDRRKTHKRKPSRKHKKSNKRAKSNKRSQTRKSR